MKEQLADTEHENTFISLSLVEIDPNLERMEDGLKFAENMFKSSNANIDNRKPILPTTEIECIPKVLYEKALIEELQKKIAFAETFQQFFANVYCDVYMTSLTP